MRRFETGDLAQSAPKSLSMKPRSVFEGVKTSRALSGDFEAPLDRQAGFAAEIIEKREEPWSAAIF
jgi:hypothetical protein